MNCQTCGRPVDKPTVFMTQAHNTLYLCPNCVQYSGLCDFCYYSQNCDFETNPSTIPKQKSVSQNTQNGIYMTTIRNPARISITCEVGCKCWNTKDKSCNREFHTCSNYQIFIDK